MLEAKRGRKRKGDAGKKLPKRLKVVDEKRVDSKLDALESLAYRPKSTSAAVETPPAEITSRAKVTNSEKISSPSQGEISVPGAVEVAASLTLERASVCEEGETRSTTEASDTIHAQTAPPIVSTKRKRKLHIHDSFPTGTTSLNRLHFLADLLLKDIDGSWREIIETRLFTHQGYCLLHNYAEALSRKEPIFPPSRLVFEAFRFSKFRNTNVVILGQDPYHRPGQATGLAFSISNSVSKLPPSLKNIYSEIGLPDNKCGDLSSWAKQGVLLLNPVLTVEEGKPNSHAHLGWQWLTDYIMEQVSREQKKVFMLWGAKAQDRCRIISPCGNLFLMASHPSPLATKGDFKGCGHFVKCNEFLKKNNLPEIEWKSVCQGKQLLLSEKIIRGVEKNSRS